MSMHLKFEPHSWYMGFAIKMDPLSSPESSWKWLGVTVDGNTNNIHELTADTLDDLKYKIRRYHLEARNGYGERIAAKRLKYIRECIAIKFVSYEEIAELQSLAYYAKQSGDVTLMEWAGVPEGEA